MSKNLKIVLKKVGKEPTVETIENTLKAKQKLVDGLIEIVSVAKDILLVCNEEGKILNMPPNLLFDYDYIAGDCFFVGDDYKNGDFKSLTDKQIKEVEEMIKERNFIYLTSQKEKNSQEREL